MLRLISPAIVCCSAPCCSDLHALAANQACSTGELLKDGALMTCWGLEVEKMLLLLSNQNCGQSMTTTDLNNLPSVNTYVCAASMSILSSFQQRQRQRQATSPWYQISTSGILSTAQFFGDETSLRFAEAYSGINMSSVELSFPCSL